jgi:hypothetical protein
MLLRQFATFSYVFKLDMMYATLKCTPKQDTLSLPSL